MRKVLARVLLFIMLINTIFSTGLQSVFASGDLTLKWNSTLTLSDSLEQEKRDDDSDEVFLSWAIGKQNGVSVDNGTYTLTYPISNDKEIEFKIVKNNDNATITYKVNGDNSVDFSTNSTQLEVYKFDDKVYKLANTKNFPEIDPNHTLGDIDAASGNAKSVTFNISKGKGFSFRYMGNTIKFSWKDDLFYFVTNGISQGNIYNFNLELDKDNNNVVNYTDSINVFTGINKSTFKSTPIANSGKGTTTLNPVDQTGQRPLTETIGENPEIQLSFELPKEYNKGTKQFEYIDPADSETAKKSTQVILDLGNTDSSKAFQVIINNIYANDLQITGLPSEITAEIKRSDDNSTITLTLKNSPGVSESEAKIVAGLIYNPVKITATRNSGDYAFEQLATSIPIGTIYTYPKYSIVSLGSKEFYIKLTPFKGYNGYYTIMQGSGTLEKWAEYEEVNKGAEDIMIAVPISLEGDYSPEKFFQIEFRFAPSEDSPKEETVLKSQILKYKADESDIMLGTPSNLQVIESDIIKNIDLITGEESENLFVTFKWDIGYEDTIKSIIKRNNNIDIPIKYTFYEGEKPEDENEEELIAATVYAKNDGTYTVSEAAKDDLNLTPYSSGTFLKGEVKTRVETVNGKQVNFLEGYASFKIPVSSKDDSTLNLQLQYPNIYFITVKGNYGIINSANSKIEPFETSKSLPATLTLNGILDIELLNPQNVSIVSESVTESEFKVQFDTLEYAKSTDLLNSYYQTMIEKNGLAFGEKSIKYNAYITQDKNLFDEMIKSDSTGTDKYENLSNSLKSKIKTYNYENKVIRSDGIDATIAIDGNSTILDYLRSNNIVKIENMVQNKDTAKQVVPFTNLDENQIYYVMLETVVEPIDSSDKIFNARIDISKYSTILTVTTVKEGGSPSDSEKNPAAPTNFTFSDVTLNSANLIWDRVTEVGEESTLEYQFIKTRGEQLSSNFLSTRESYKKTWEQLSNISSKEGFKTSGTEILEYIGDDFYVAYEEDYYYQSYTGTKGNILDQTLSPNQVYFYYIRTVRIIDGEDVAYSVWVPLTFTTSNVEGPTNLKVDRTADYNPQTQIVINFDIPKMDTSLIGSTYQLQYSIRKDTGDWQSDQNMKEVNIVDKGDGKTMNVTYKITGLDPGCMYTIRVRLYNTELKSYSIYSNEVQHRTDGSVSQNEYDSSINNWYNYFSQFVKKLEQQPYWFMEDNTSNTSVIFRDGYFENVLFENSSNIIDLPEGKGGNIKEYYIPASTVLQAFNQNKGFKISYNGMDVIFSPKSIDPSQNDAIKKLEEKRKTESLQDYFVKLTANFSNSTCSIEGTNNVSPVATVSMDVIGTSKQITEWDSNVAGYINELLATKEYSTYLQENLKTWLEKTNDSLTIGQSIDSYVNSFEKEFGSYVKKQLNAISKRTYSSSLLQGNIIITYPFSSNVSPRGYKLALGSWIGQTLYDYNGKKAIYSVEFGSFTFTGEEFIINGITNIENGATIIQIITKYGLDDYLGKSGNIDLKATLTNNMAIGSLARLAGNSKTVDPIEFFKGKGVTVSSRNSTSSISTQEMIYLTMQVYQIRTGQKIDSIKIRNYNLTSAITGISDKYKKSIQVAFELGIYTNENMNPTGTTTVQEFLQMIANFYNKVGL